MKMETDIKLSRTEILSALDYMTYLDKRLERAEDAWWEISHQVKRLEKWLERVSASQQDVPQPSEPINAPR